MADSINIPINIRPGDLSGLDALRRQVEKTKAQLSGLGDFEVIPGSTGIRRRGSNAQPGVGTYGQVFTPPPTNLPPRSTAPATAFQQAIPHVRAYGQAIQHANQNATTLGNTLEQLGRVTPLDATPGGRRPLSGRALVLLGPNAALPPGGPPPAGGDMASPSGDPRQGGALRFLPQRRPPLAPDEEDVSGGGGRFQAGFQRVGGYARGVLGLAAGVSILQTLSQAMQNYEARATGVLRIGSLLDEQYGDVNTGLINLRHTYHVLAQEGVAAMTSLARVTGNLRGLPAAIAFGRAYGIEPEQAALLQGHFARMTGEAEPSLGAISLVQREAQRGSVTPLPVARFAEETAGIAGVGGTGFLPLGTEQYARFGALMTGFGTRFAAQPAQAYAEYAGGLTRNTGPAFDALRRQAVSELAQRQPTIQIGTQRLNIRDDYADYQQAIELAGQSPEIQEAYFQMAQRQGAGHVGLQRMFFQGMFGAGSMTTARQTFEGLQKQASEPGGIAGALRPRFTAQEYAAEDATERARIARGETTEGGELRRRAAEVQALGETGAVAALEKVRTDVQNALGTFADGVNKHKGIVDTVTETFSQLSSTSKELLGVMMMLVGPGKYLRLGGAALTALGMGQQEAESGRFFGEPLTPGSYMPLSSGPRLLTPDESNLVPRKSGY